MQPSRRKSLANRSMRTGKGLRKIGKIGCRESIHRYFLLPLIIIKENSKQQSSVYWRQNHRAAVPPAIPLDRGCVGHSRDYRWRLAAPVLLIKSESPILSPVQGFVSARLYLLAYLQTNRLIRKLYRIASVRTLPCGDRLTSRNEALRIRSRPFD